MNSENLRTASLYINNQLLSRGLLRDGRTIDFDHPGDDDYELAETMGRIMSVVNDLILRRDRDAEHRESLSTTLRTLRADSLRQTDHLSRLQDRFTDAQRKVALADAHEAALQAQLKAAEVTIHKLKDDAVRTKKLVADTRAACATDVRRRDRQIDALKKAVAEAGRARGERKSAGITTIHVTGEVGGDEGGAAMSSVMDEGYDLRQETNGFLAQLAKGLSEENETALALIRKTFGSLKEMSGWGKENQDNEDAATGKRDGNRVVELSVNPEDILPDMEGVLSHLRTMLSNPAFVPIEELEIRDEEIFRLRDGWEKMEVRWQEAVRLIDSWRRRMAADGRPVDIEELKMGLRLSPVRVKKVAETAQGEHVQLSTLMEEEEEEEEEEEQISFEAQQQGSPSPPESLHLVPADDYRDMVPEYDAHDGLDDSDSESSIFHDDVDADVDMEDLDIIEPNVEVLNESAASSLDSDASPSSTLPPPPKITPLEETSVAGNRKPPQETTEKSRKRSGHLIEDTASQSAEVPTPPAHGGQSPQKRLKTSKDVSNDKSQSRPDSGLFTNSNSSLDSVLLLEPAQDSTSSKASSNTTARSTRSATSTKKPSPASAKPVTKAARAPPQEKKEPPAKPLIRQRSARAVAPTATSSSRTARSKPEPTKPRPAAAGAAMPPPPRPTRTSSNSSHTNSPAAQVQSTPKAQKKSSPADNKPPTAAHPPSTTTATDSPNRQPSATKSASRLPRSKAINALLPVPHQSPVTVAGIAAKLAASEREANAARVRAKLKAARLGKNSNNSATASTAGSTTKPQLRAASGASSAASASVSVDENGLAGGVSINDAAEAEAEAPARGSAGSNRSKSNDTEPAQLSPRKRRGVGEVEETKDKEGDGDTAAAATKRKRDVRSRAARVASRRRSTLSPWELQSLIAGDVAPVE